MVRSTPLIALAAALSISAAPVPQPPKEEPWPQAEIEIFKLAPGRQEAFIRKLAQWDEVSAAGGVGPTQMYVHEDGDEWDILLLKPFAKTPITASQQAAMDAKAEQMGLKTGPAFWLEIRQNMSSHTENKTDGPLSAANWLARLDAWRVSHPDAAKKE